MSVPLEAICRERLYRQQRPMWSIDRSHTHDVDVVSILQFAIPNLQFAIPSHPSGDSPHPVVESIVFRDRDHTSASIR